MPYAQTSLPLPPNSPLSKRIARTAFAPIASASWVSRAIASCRPSASIFVMPLSSPPYEALQPGAHLRAEVT